jgi:hypothetical protein
MDWIHKHPEVAHFHDAYIAAREGARNALDRVFCGEITREAYFGLMDRVAGANEAYLAAWKRVYDSRDRVDLALTDRAS